MCGACFKVDGHGVCSSHAPCLHQDLVFDPWACNVCMLIVEALLQMEQIDETSAAYLLLKKHWMGLQKLLSHHQLPADWFNGNPRTRLGFCTKRDEHSGTSSASLTSAESSVTDKVIIPARALGWDLLALTSQPPTQETCHQLPLGPPLVHVSPLQGSSHVI